MRVISGCARGHKLVAPEGLETRPTTDRIKETMFNVIAPSLPGCKFLDLFSGSGAIGIEALSRGGEKSVFVDESSNAISIINQNLAHTKLGEKALVLKTDVFSAIKGFGKNGEKFDIVFMDPPYALELYEKVIKALMEENVLEDNCLIIAEQPSLMQEICIPGLSLIKTKKFKTTIMSFWTLGE